MAAPRPEHAHATARPATATPLPRPAHTTTGWRQDRRPVVSKRPLHRLAAAKMSPHIHIGPEPVLAAHARSLPAAGSRCPAGADSAPHSEQNFFPLTGQTSKKVLLSIIWRWQMACNPIVEQSALNARSRRVGAERSCEAVWRRQARKQAGIHGGAEAPRQRHTRVSPGMPLANGPRDKRYEWLRRGRQ